MKKFLLLTFLGAAIVSTSYATHSAGGELYYCSLGSGNYAVTYIYYRNCGSPLNPAPAPAPASVIVKAQSVLLAADISFTLFQLPQPNGIDVTQMCAYTFVPATTCNSVNPLFQGFQRWVFRDTITLPAPSTDWVLSCDVNARAQNITTISNPGNISLYVEATLDNVNAASNCSPVFSNVPMFYACVGMPGTWNYSATDADGDSLVYSLATARSTVTNVVTPVPYLPPFSPTNPLTTSAPGFTIDANTGMVSFTPTVNGEVTSVCFRIDEYRNNILIGSVIRDHMLVTTVFNFSLIAGHLFVDTDSNNVQDPGELGIANRRVTDTNTGRFGFSQSTGAYSIGITDTGNFTVSPFPFACYSAVPASHSVYFPATQLVDSLNDFAFQPSIPGNDLCVTITPLSAFRAGFNAGYIINYENVGTTTVNNCSVIFFRDINITYVSSSPAPVSVTTDSVIWNIGTLVPFQTGSIWVAVHVNTGVPVNTLIDSGVRIEPVAGDVNPGCNSAWRLYTIGSYDPNDIIVNENTLWTTQFPNPPYLEYIIRFQNTGNDTAFIVNVRNPIDTNMLELNTLEFVSSSHTVNLQWMVAEQKIEFSFDNILLPDSNVNEPGSHGFVRYRIKPKSTLIAGDNIINNADIYFDFNAPVATNNAVTNIVLLTSSSGTLHSGNIQLYPNPVGNELVIMSSEFGDKSEIEIYNVLGERIFIQQQTTNDKQQTVNVSQLPSGIYFVKVKTDKGIIVAKFVKQ